MNNTFKQGFEKTSQFGLDLTAMDVLGAIPAGTTAGIGMAGSTANVLSRRGTKTRNEDIAKNIGKVTSVLGTLAGIGLALKHKEKLHELAHKYISSDPTMHGAYTALVPFIGGVSGGLIAGGSTGAAVSLRGRSSHKKPAEDEDEGEEDEG